MNSSSASAGSSPRNGGLASVRVRAGALILLSVTAFIIVTWLHFRQEAAIGRSRQLLISFREARIELAKGFIDIALSGEPDSLFHAEEGFPLLDKALSTFHEAMAEIPKSTAPSTSDHAALYEAFGSGLAGFRGRLTEYRSSDPAARRALRPPLQASFQELEDLAQRVDAINLDDALNLRAWLDTQYWITLAVFAALASLYSAFAYRLRRKSIAADGAARIQQDLIREIELRYRALFEEAVDGILLTDSEGGIIKANPAFARMHGYELPEEIESLCLHDLLTPETMALLPERLRRANDGERLSLEVGHRRKDGSAFLSSVSATRVDFGGRPCLLSFHRDITERVRAEESLRESERRYTTLFQKSNIPVVLIKLPEVVIADANEAAEKLTGFARQEMIGKTSADLGMISHSQRTETIDEYEREHALTGREMRIVTKTGEERVIFISTHPIEINGQPFAFTSMQDITDRKSAEERLRTNEARARAMLDAIPDMMFRMNREGVYLDYKAAILDSREQTVTLQGRRIRDVIPPELAELVQARIAETLDTGRTVTFEYRSPIPGVGSRDFEARMASSGPNEVIAIVRDITERAQAAEALRQSEARRALALNAAQAGTWEWDLATGANVWSDEIWGLYGLEPHGREPSYEAWRETILPEDRDRVERELQDIVRREAELNLEWRIPDPVSGNRWIISHGGPLRDASGRAIRYVGVVMDITERKRSEAALAMREEVFSAVVDQAEDAIAVFDATTGRFVEFNAAMHEGLGYSREEFARLGVLDFQVEHSLETIKRNLRMVQEQGAAAFETRHRRKDGRVRDVRVSLRRLRVENRGYIAVVWRDITESKRAEAELRESEEHFRALYEQAGVGVAEIETPMGRFLRINKRFGDIIGYGPEEMLALDFQTITHPEDLPEDLAQMERLKAGEIGEFTMEKRYYRKDGSIVWASLTVSPMWAPGAAPTKHIAVVQDITGRKRAEEELRASEEKHRGLMESLDSVVALIDVDGEILYMNEVAAASLGGRAEDFIGKTMHELFPFEVAERQLGLVRRAIETDESVTDEDLSVVNGRPRWFKTTVQPIHGAKGDVTHALINSTDIHELKTAQRELLELNKTLEARVKERAARVRDLYDNAPAGYHSLDEKGRFTEVNNTELRWLGYDRDELLGRHVEDILTTASKATFRENFPRFKATGILSELALEYRRKDGTTFAVLVNASAICDDSGRFVASRTTSIDVTELRLAEKELQEREEQNRLLFEESPVALALMDEEGRIARANRAGQQLFGLPLETLAGKRLPELGLVSEPAANELRAASVRARLDSDSGGPAQIILTKPDGRAVDAEARAFPFVVGGAERILVSLVDVSAHKRAEEALRRANLELEGAMRVKDEFLSTMSHEIRTPMNAIIGMSDLALKTDLSPRQRGFVAKVHDAGVSLLGIINDILDFSKMEAGKVSIERVDFDLDEVLANLGTILSPKVTEKGLDLWIKVQNDMPRAWRGDQLRLGQVLLNLVGNAVKFTDRGEVSLTVELAERSGRDGTLLFTVRDTGIGMTADQVGRLFQPFTQGDGSTTRRFGGTGLGLSISKRLVELMGGGIWAQSEPGKGSVFRFTVALEEAAGPAASSARSLGSLVGMRALVVDDNPTARTILRSLAGELRLKIDEAASGEEAIVRIEREDREDPYRLVLMDYHMPGMDGLTAIRKIKRGKGLVSVPVVFLVTASAGGEDWPRAEEAGADEYLAMPITLSALSQAIERHFMPGSARAPAPCAPDRTRRLGGLRVLLVEDVEVNCEIVVELLRPFGIEVLVAKNGREAVDLVLGAGRGFDAVLMDIQMPVMDGYEATRRIRADGRFASLPLIAMSAYAMEEERRKALDCGMDEHLSKPIDPGALLDALERHCSGAEVSESALHGAAIDGAPRPPISALEDIEGLNQEDGLSRVMGNFPLYRTLLRRFLDYQIDVPERIISLAASGDLKGAERLAHSLRGLAGNLGAAAAQREAEVVERSLGSGAPGDVEALVAPLGRNLERLAADLRAALGADGRDGAARPGDGSRAPAALAEIAYLVESFDTDAAAYFSGSRADLLEVFPAERLRVLELALSRYDFSAAREWIEDAKARLGG